MVLSKLIGEIDFLLYQLIIDWYRVFGAVLIIMFNVKQRAVKRITGTDAFPYMI